MSNHESLAAAAAREEKLMIAAARKENEAWRRMTAAAPGADKAAARSALRVASRYTRACAEALESLRARLEERRA